MKITQAEWEETVDFLLVDLDINTVIAATITAKGKDLPLEFEWLQDALLTLTNTAVEKAEYLQSLETEGKLPSLNSGGKALIDFWLRARECLIRGEANDT